LESDVIAIQLLYVMDSILETSYCKDTLAKRHGYSYSSFPSLHVNKYIISFLVRCGIQG